MRGARLSGALETVLLGAVVAVATGVMTLVAGRGLAVQVAIATQLQHVAPRSVLVAATPASLTIGDRPWLRLPGVAATVPIQTSTAAAGAGIRTRTVDVVATGRAYPGLVALDTVQGHWWPGTRQAVAVVNQAAARQLKVSLHRHVILAGVPFRVEGVVGDVPGGLPAPPTIYVPWQLWDRMRGVSPLTAWGVRVDSGFSSRAVAGALVPALQSAVRVLGGPARVHWMVITRAPAVQAAAAIRRLVTSFRRVTGFGTTGLVGLVTLWATRARVQRRRRAIGLALGFGAPAVALWAREVGAVGLTALGGAVTGIAAGTAGLALEGALPPMDGAAAAAAATVAAWVVGVAGASAALMAAPLLGAVSVTEWTRE
ncbi:MAG: ABC transporter permease [Firmicutes bacterium]|nr:ABC transporter permease [Bacillota bacterium]